MSKPNGSRPIQRLAEALQDCLDSAAQQAAQNVKEELIPRLDNMDSRLDKQDATLRMMWRQGGGKETDRLPIDD